MVYATGFVKGILQFLHEHQILMSYIHKLDSKLKFNKIVLCMGTRTSATITSKLLPKSSLKKIRYAKFLYDLMKMTMVQKP